MSVTYTDHDATHAETEAYVPVYARKRRTGGAAGRGGFKAWMVLAPLGVLTVGGVAAAMMMAPGEEAAPAVETAEMTSAPLPAAPLTPPVMETSPMATPEPVAATPAPMAAPAPVRAAPVERRAAPVRRTAAAPVPAVTPTEETGDEATAELNRAQAQAATPAPTATPTPTPTVTPPAPTIQVQPFPGQ